METVAIRLLGDFSVSVDGRAVPADAFPQRRAADLIKVLALAPGHRLPRDAVVETLWAHLEADAGLANLHKAAHYARRALGGKDAVVLRRGFVELCPGAELTTDVERFEAGDDSAYAGDLLPDDPYEPWAIDARERLRGRAAEALRRQGDWKAVLAADPTDETAHVELLRDAVRRGDRTAAARRFRQVREEFAALGLPPPDAAVELIGRLGAGPPVQAAARADRPLIGRDAAMEQAAAALARAEGGSGGALVVVGDAGIGKSRMVDALLDRAAERGWHTTRGQASQDEGRVPYRPLVEAIDPLLAERPDLVAVLGDGVRRVLALLAPSAPRPRAATGDEQEGGPAKAATRHEAFAALGRYLTTVSGDRPLLLTLEDVHAADDATLQFLHYVARAAAGDRLLVVATARPGDAHEGFRRLRAGLAQQGAATEIRLGPLDGAAIRELASLSAGRALEQHVLDAIAHAAAGNPFLAQELGAAAGPSGEVTIPGHVREVLSLRLARLPDDAAGVLPVIAVLHDGFGADEVAAVAGRDPESTESALEQAVDCGVLERDGGGYRFRQPLLRETARERMPPQRLRAAHADAAAALARAGAPPERVAFHLVEAGREGEAVPLLAEAGRRAAGLGAYLDGRRWVEVALRHAEPEARPALLALLGDLRHATGDPRAAAAYAQALDGAPAADHHHLRLKEARAHLSAGDLDAADRALTELPEGTAHEQAQALVVAGMLAWFRGDMDAARERADAAAAAATLAGSDAELLADLRAMVAHAEGGWQHHVQWQLAEVWQLPELAGRVFDAYLCVTEYVLYADDPAGIASFARRLRDEARRAGARRGEAFSATVLGEALLLAGDVEAARQPLLDAVRLSRAIGAVGGESLARTRLSEALAELGETEGARAQIEEALELATASHLDQHLIYLTLGPMVRIAADAGDGLAAVDRAEALVGARAGCHFCPVGYDLAAASACARAGDLDRAWELLRRAEPATALWRGGPWSAAAAECRGEIRIGEGALAEAEADLRRAIDGFSVAGHRLHAERAQRTLESAQSRAATAAQRG